ncbi:MAG: hypothetical protein WD079_00250, partial [Phycisphaeraceae bacterium]
MEPRESQRLRSGGGMTLLATLPLDRVPISASPSWQSGEARHLQMTYLAVVPCAHIPHGQPQLASVMCPFSEAGHPSPWPRFDVA